MNTIIESIQKLIDGDWKYAAAAREACRNKTWNTFQKNHIKKPFLFNVFAHISFQRCLHKISKSFTGPLQVEMLMMPVWLGQNMDDMPGKRWEKVFITKSGKEPFSILECSKLNKQDKEELSSLITFKAHLWQTRLLIETKYYADSVPLIYRGIPYGVMDYPIVEIDHILHQSLLKPISKPTEIIPAFTIKMLPALENLPEDIEVEIMKYHM